MSKVALVTGANRGLGFEVARQLAQAGGTVVVGARDAQKGEDAAERLRAEGLNAESVVLDVNDVASVERAADELRERHGAIDVLVNNAGILPEATAGAGEAVDAALFRQTFDTNVIGASSRPDPAQQRNPSQRRPPINETKLSTVTLTREPEVGGAVVQTVY